MSVLKILEWFLGFIFSIYLYKALLGKLRDGDGIKAVIVVIVSLLVMLLQEL